MPKNAEIKAQSEQFESFALCCFKNTFSKLDNISFGVRVIYFFLGVAGIFADIFLLTGRCFIVSDAE